jgi:hypothetical protein
VSAHKPTRAGRPKKTAEQKYKNISITMHPFDFAKLERIAKARLLTRSQALGVIIQQEPEPTIKAARPEGTRP